MTHPALDSFGQLLMREVRDRAIDDWLMILSGHMKGERAGQLFSSLKEDQKELLKLYAPEIVDTTLHWLLCLLDGREDVRLVVDAGDGLSSIAALSDGLPGELYTDDGWIARFSRKPEIPT